MKSLSARLLISVSLLLLFFFGATIVVLDTAFRTAGERASEDILNGHLMAMLAAADPTGEGELSLPPDLPESRFNSIGSGLYAEMLNSDNGIIWRSRSALGIDLPGGMPAGSPAGNRLWQRARLADGTPMFTLSLAVQWEFPDGSLKPYSFEVAESLEGFNAQVSAYRRQLFGWFAGVALVMLLSIAILMRRLLRPLRQIETEIGQIETGSRSSLSLSLPTELAGVARNLNVLIDSERARSERYKLTLDNLAHSLKTPLAALRSLLTSRDDPRLVQRCNEQIDRMDEIVRYQLRKPAHDGTKLPMLSAVSIAPEVERLVSGLQKVYRDKHPVIDTTIDTAARFIGDRGDFLELVGNLLDNACKWCDQHVALDIRNMEGLQIVVSDDGPGIPDEAKTLLVTRGMRLDEAMPGHGIGLAIVSDIARSYGGVLGIKSSSDLGGAEITVTIPAR